MADQSTGPYMGDANFAFTEAELATIAEKDPSFYNALRANALRNAFYFPIPLQLQTAVGNTTSTGIQVVIRFPCRVFYAEVGCEAAAGGSATAKVEVALAATPTSFTTLTTGGTSGNVDIKTAAPILQGSRVDAAKSYLAVGDIVRLSITGASGGNVTGGFGILHAVRVPSATS